MSRLHERSDTFGTVPYVPDFDVSSRNSEDETGSVSETHRVRYQKHRVCSCKHCSHCCLTSTTWLRQRCSDDLLETWSPDLSPSSRLCMCGLKISIALEYSWQPRHSELTIWIFTFGSGEQQVICGIYTENRFGVAFCYIDAMEFGPAAGLRGCHGIDHTSNIDHIIE